MNPNPPRKKNLSLSLVKPIASSTLDKFKRLNIAEAEVDAEIAKLGDVSQLHDEEPQLIHLLCNFVENISNVKLTGQEKKDFVVKKITSLLPVLNNNIDLKWINKTIDMLCIICSVKSIDTSIKTLQGVKTVCGFFSKN